jgi:micrococcal nuclease
MAFKECPQCGEHSAPRDRYCESCGTDIADVDTQSDSAVNYLPGIDLNDNPTRRNVLVGGAYSLVGVGILGAASTTADTEEPSSSTAGSDDSSSDGGAATLEPTPTPTEAPTPSPTETDSETPTETETETQTESETETETETPTQSGPATSWTVTVTEVIDGDTVDVAMPDGTEERLRLLGVDTPETSITNTSPSEWPGIPSSGEGRTWLAARGEDATEYANERLADEEVYIEVDESADRRGSFDRLLVYVYQDESTETSFNKRLLSNGHARVYETSFSKRDAFDSAEADAQDAEIGVWSYESPTGNGGIILSEVHEDAQGTERENLDDEYVVFENTGSDAVEMGAWRLLDEAEHTYIFPSDFVLDAGQFVTVYTGKGDDSDTELYWGRESPVWNNSGDTVILRNSDGETVIEQSY